MSGIFSLQELIGEIPYKAEMKPTLVDTPQLLEAVLQEINKWPFIVFDLETKGFSFLHHPIVGIALCSKGTASYYIPLRHVFGDNLDPAIVLPKLQVAMRSKPTVAHNIKFDYNFIYFALEQLGIPDPDINTTHCTLIMDSVLNPSEVERHGLKQVIKTYFGVEMVSFEDVSADHDFSLVDTADAVLYAGGDVYWTCKLFEYLKPQLVSQKLVETYKLEMDCTKAFAEMERVGFPIDMAKIDPVIKDTQNQIATLTVSIHKLAGHAFNIDSTQDLSKVLFIEQNIRPPDNKNEDGSWSTAAEVLEARADHEIVQKVLWYRTLEKMLNSFLLKVKEKVCEDGRIRTRFNQCRARSGRVATSGGIGPKGIDPKLNMQNFPKAIEKDDINFRAFLVAPEGYYIAAADYKQIEYRLMACISGETEIIEMLRKGWDFHKATAAMMFRKAYDQVTKADRQKGKTLNFGICYGMSHYSLAKQLGISPAEAKALQEQYFARLQKLQKYIEMIKDSVLNSGEVRTVFGRKRDFSNIRTTKDKKAIESMLRAAFNTVIQGTAADVNKKGLAKLYPAKAKYGKKVLMALNVHDEIVLFVHNSIPVEEVTILLRNMEQEYPEKGWCPLGVDVSIGNSYRHLQSLSEDKEIPVEVDVPNVVEVKVESFSRAVIIKTGQFANFEKIKSACSPASPAEYRVVLVVAGKPLLLPDKFTFNPTRKLTEFVEGIEGVESVDIKVVEVT